MPKLTRQKITFAEMRAAGLTGKHRELWRLLRTLFEETRDTDELMGLALNVSPAVWAPSGAFVWPSSPHAYLIDQSPCSRRPNFEGRVHFRLDFIASFSLQPS